MKTKEEILQMFIHNGIDYPYLPVGQGWYELIYDLVVELLSTNWDRKILQIKEKFGGLRFYIDGSEDIQNIVTKYEKLSYSICEECGEPGEIRKLNWIKTLCDKHYNLINETK